MTPANRRLFVKLDKRLGLHEGEELDDSPYPFVNLPVTLSPFPGSTPGLAPGSAPGPSALTRKRVPLSKSDHLSTAMAYATCDVQMLRGRAGEYIVKEFALYEKWSGGNIIGSATFAPPYPEDQIPITFLRQNAYVVTNMHGLVWNAGETTYTSLQSTLSQLTSGYNRLYVKGEEKKYYSSTSYPQ